MLRIRSLGASALVLLAFTGLASAADVYRAPPPVAQPIYTPVPVQSSWAGHYVGVLGGYGQGTGTVGNTGWIGGVYAGSNWAVDQNLIVGLEADGSFTNKTGSSGGTRVQNPWDATIRGRIGYGAGNWLLYGTAGVAFGEVKATTTTTTATATRTGWTAGGGVEAKLTSNVSARVEYRYTDLGTSNFALPNPSVTYHSNDVLLGLGFHF